MALVTGRRDWQVRSKRRLCKSGFDKHSRSSYACRANVYHLVQLA
jgi:hypothetical protein